jgi:hypothetical protein
MPMLFVNGTNDFAYPLDSYQRSYRLVKNRNLCIMVNMPHGHPQGWAPKEIGLFVDHHLRAEKRYSVSTPLVCAWRKRAIPLSLPSSKLMISRPYRPTGRLIPRARGRNASGNRDRQRK